MKIATKKGLHLLIVTMIISIFGALSAIGVSADKSTFWVNTVENIPIQYKVTSDGVFKEVEVIAPMKQIAGLYYRPEGYHKIPGGKVTIPETVVYDNVEYTVTSIGEGAFSVTTSSYIYGGHVYNSSLKNITIPDSVKCIKRNAFFDCCYLTEIDLPNNLEVIEPGAFYGTGLTAVEIPKSVTDIGDFAFAECWKLTTVISLSKKPANVDSRSFVNINWVNSSGSRYEDYELVYNSNLKIYVPLVSKDAYVKAGWPKDQLEPVYNFSL